eukprot:12549161-Ditylum_brightwellii.AAC.2
MSSSVLPEYDVLKLTSISEFQQSNWDETHPKARIVMHRSAMMVFVRRDNQCSVKYNKEVCLLIGVAKLKYNDGQIAGVCLRPLIYTDKTVVSHKDYQQFINLEIGTVKKCGLPWYWVSKFVRQECVVWEEESIFALKGVGKGISEKLECARITTVKDLKYILNNKSAMEKIIVKSQDGNGKGGLTLNTLG